MTKQEQQICYPRRKQIFMGGCNITLLKAYVLLFCIFVASMLQAYESPFLGDARPKRSIRIGDNVIANLNPGVNTAEIVVADNCSQMTRFAAFELQNLLDKKIGSKLPVVNKPTAGKVSFILGINKFSKAAKINDSKLCRDAFIIRTLGNKIYILGRDDPKYNEFAAVKRVSGWQFNYEKGTLFGVYDFLERFAGARFFFTGAGTIIPKGTLKIPKIDIYDRPDYEARQVQIYSGKHFAPGNGVYQRNMDYLRMRFQTKYIPCCHGLGSIGYFQRFGKTHPEYFAMDKTGKRVKQKRQGVWMPHFCYTGKVKEEIYQDAKSCLLNEPASKRGIITPYGKIGWDPTAQLPGSVFCAMPGDSFLRCQCKKCKPFMKDERTISDFMWGFVFDIAERLQKEKVPGIVTNMVYSPYRHIPRGRKMPSNVYVMIASLGAWCERYPDIQRKYTKSLSDWVKFGGHKVWLWNYSNKFAAAAFPGIPHTTPKAIGNYYKKMAPMIYGAFLESETDYYQFNLPSYYIFSKISWNNKADVNKLLEDYYKTLFGPAAVPMKKFFERVESLWMRKLMKAPIVTDLGPSQVTASNHEAWTAVYSQAERASLKKLFNEAESLAARKPQVLSRVKIFRKIFLDVIVKHGKEYDRQIDSIPRFGANVRLLKAREKVKIDGILNEPVWKKGGVWLQNVSGKKTNTSRVMITADEKNLYVAFNFAEPFMRKVVAPKRKSKDSDVWKDNGIEIFLNLNCDRKIYYQLILSSSGCLRTYRHEKNGATRKSFAWSPNTVQKVVAGTKSWRGELSIPLADLNMKKPEKVVANFCRHQVKKGMPEQYYSWSPFLNRKLTAMFHDINDFGTIYFNKEKSVSLLRDGNFSLPHGRARNVFGAWNHAAICPPGVKASYDKNYFISGFRSIRLESKGKTISVKQYLPKLKPGKKYKISFFVRLANIKKKGKASGVVLNICDDRNRWFPSTWLSGTLPWTYQEGIFTAGPKTNNKKHRSYMLLYLMGCSGKVWFDNIRLKEVK